MAIQKNSPALQRWIDALPLNEHPLVKLLEVLKQPDLPASLRIEGLLGAARFFSPIFSSSKNEITGTVDHKPVTISHQQVLESLHAAGVKSPEDLQKVLEGKKTLLLKGRISDGEISGTN